MANFAAHAARPKTRVVNFATANTARDGTGTIATLVTAAAGGERIDNLFFNAAGTTTAGVLRVFYKEASADTWRLLEELLVTAVTPSTTVKTFETQSAKLIGFTFGAGNMLGVATHNAEAFNAVLVSGEI